MTIMHTISGGAIDVLPVGTRIRHKQHTDLVGTIFRLVFHKSGNISPIPYYVAWDCELRARTLIAGMFRYASNDGIEEVTL